MQQPAEKAGDSSMAGDKMIERRPSPSKKSMDSSLSPSEISSTEEEDKTQEEGGSSKEGCNGEVEEESDGRAAAAAAAVAAAVQQQQEQRELQRTQAPLRPRGEAACLQSALEQQQREEQKLYMEQLETRPSSLRWRKKSSGRREASGASSSSSSSASSISASSSYSSSSPAAARDGEQEEEDEEGRRDRGGSRTREEGELRPQMRGETAVSPETGGGGRTRAPPHSFSPTYYHPHHGAWPAGEGTVADAVEAAAAEDLLPSGSGRGGEGGEAAAAPASASSAAAAPQSPRARRRSSRGVVGWGPAAAAAGYHHHEGGGGGYSSSSTAGGGRQGEQQQQHQRQQLQRACFDDVIVRPFEPQDAAAVKRLCYRHFRSLTLPSVFFWICHHSVDAAALFCISLCFLPVRGVLLSAACFFIYLLLRGVYEFELYIKRDCPDLDDIYESYMRSRASGFWVAERLQRSPPSSSSRQQAAAGSSSEDKSSYSSNSSSSAPDGDAAPPSSTAPPAKRRIVGCIGLAPLQTDKKTAQLVRLVVDRSQRRQHIGTLLLNTLIAYALQQHYSIIRLYTNNLNSDSIRFAKTKGFELQQIVRRGLMRGDLLKWQKKLEVPGMTQRKTRAPHLASSVLD